MSRGTRGRARSPAGRRRTRRLPTSTRSAGGCTFAEDPVRAAPEARIIWHADLDPGTLAAVAVATDREDPDRIAFETLRPWLTVATDPDGREHVVLSDGWRHIRLDIVAGSLAAGPAIVLHYRLQGIASLAPKLRPLGRLLDLVVHRRFSASRFPVERRTGRWVTLLRVHDALADGASQREIGIALFGADRVADGWAGPSDSLRSRVRRLAADARAMARGGWRSLISGGSRTDHGG